MKRGRARIVEADGMPEKAPENLRTHLRRGALGTSTILFLSSVLGLLSALILARLLGAKGYGIFAYAMSWARVLSIFAVAGLPQLLTREVSVHQSRYEWGLLRGIVRWATRTVLLMSAAMMLLGVALGSWLILRGFRPHMILVTLIALAILPLLALTRLNDYILRGLHHVLPGQIPEGIARPILFLALLGADLVVFRSGLSALMAMEMQILAFALAYLLSFYLLKKRLPPSLKTERPVFRTDAWFQSAWPMFLASSAAILDSQIGIIILGAMKGAYDTGIFSVALRGASMVPFFLAAANVVLQPTVASLYASGQMQRLQKIITQSSRLILIFSIPVVALLALFGDHFLALLGPEFTNGQTALLILIAGQFVNIACGSVGLLLNFTSNERTVVTATVASLILDAALNLALVPKLGFNGTAIATTVSLSSLNIILLVKTVRKLGFDPTFWGGMGKWGKA